MVTGRASAARRLPSLDRSVVSHSPLAVLWNWSLTVLLCDQSIIEGAEMPSKILQLRQVKIVRNATSRSEGRRGNDAYRVREHLTEAEMDKLLAGTVTGIG
jgi:hypothetical protein